jgi:hypothetical protein
MKIKFYPVFFTAMTALALTSYQGRADSAVTTTVQGSSDSGFLLLIALTIFLLALFLVWIQQSYKSLREDVGAEQ